VSARIYDTRYARYEGGRRGWWQPVLSLGVFGLGWVFGRGRGLRAKILPVLLLAMAFTPALAVFTLRILSNSAFDGKTLERVVPYADYAPFIGTVIAVFAAVTTPPLLCLDRRDRVLSLYLSTAVTRTQYLVGRFLSAFVPMLLIGAGPELTLWIGNVILADHPGSYVSSRPLLPLELLLAGVALALFFALIGLAISSLTPRTTFAIGAFILLVFVTKSAGGIARGVRGRHSLLSLVDLQGLPVTLASRIVRWAGSGPSAPHTVLYLGAWLVVCLACVGILVVRYRDEVS
jgi:ABC-2 type transport system permease protein